MGIGVFELLIFATILFLGAAGLAGVLFAVYFAARAGSRADRRDNDMKSGTDD